MVEKRSRYSASVRERAPSILGDLTSRIPEENVITEFLRLCREFNVQPIPTCVIDNGIQDSKNIHRLSKLSRLSSISETDRTPKTSVDSLTEIPSPTFRLTFEHPKRLENLGKIECRNKLPNCSINAYGVMQIARMLTEIGCLKDINLDMNPNVQENYHLLCVPNGNLLYLSLKLCKITDQGVKRIANELKYDDPPNEPVLIGLNLANNLITDRGASHIACMLRTNRSIQSLVLTGNQIYDDGAGLIIDELYMSALTECEILDLRRRRYAELTKLAGQGAEETSLTTIANEEKEKVEAIVDDIVSRKDQKTSKRSSLQKRNKRTSRQETEAKVKEQDMPPTPLSSLHSVDDHAGIAIRHPLGAESVPTNGFVMAAGNFQLQHLNLSFNHITGVTLQKLIKCLYYQNYMMLDDISRGLLHIFFEGNNFEDNCKEERAVIEDLLLIRRQEKYVSHPEQFGSLVPVTSKTLRKKISGKRLSM